MEKSLKYFKKADINDFVTYNNKQYRVVDKEKRFYVLKDYKNNTIKRRSDYNIYLDFDKKLSKLKEKLSIEVDALCDLKSLNERLNNSLIDNVNKQESVVHFLKQDIKRVMKIKLKREADINQKMLLKNLSDNIKKVDKLEIDDII